jgi:hypothetical protein
MAAYGQVAPILLTSGRDGSARLSVSYSRSMKKHPATWLLAALVALGAGQAVPLSSLQRSPETSAIVRVVNERREQRVHRERSIRKYPNLDAGVSHSNDFPKVIPGSWAARLLRAPPLSSIA